VTCPLSPARRRFLFWPNCMPPFCPFWGCCVSGASFFSWRPSISPCGPLQSINFFSQREPPFTPSHKLNGSPTAIQGDPYFSPFGSISAPFFKEFQYFPSYRMFSLLVMSPPHLTNSDHILCHLFPPESLI